MIYFFENPIARMYGPLFLLLYIATGIFIIRLIRSKSARLINTEEVADNVSIPLQPDPYEIAYLKGGEKQVLLLSIYSLISRGYLNVLTNNEKTDVRIGQKEKVPATAALNEQEKMVFKSTTKKEMRIANFLNEVFTEKFTECCEPLRKKLEQDNLFVSEAAEKQFRQMKSLGAGVMIFFGIYKIIAAVKHDHDNIFFLLVLTILAPVFISNVKKVKLARRDNYLDALKTAFNVTSGSDFDLQPFYMKQLQLAIFGVEVLKNSKLNYLSNYYKNNVDYPNKYWKNPDLDENDNWISPVFNIGNFPTGSCSSSSGCGSGCGSSCGGGCGGGCGGCS